MHRRVEPLLTLTVGTDERGKPTLSWTRDTAAITAASRLDGLYALATNLPAHSARSTSSTSTKTSGSSNNATATSNAPAHCGSAPCSCTTTTGSPP